MFINKELKFKINATLDIGTLNDIFRSETDIKHEWLDDDMEVIQDKNGTTQINSFVEVGL